MGLFHLGTPLSWNETRVLADQIRENAITQFLHIWDKTKDRKGDDFLWGDEIEYILVAFDEKQKNARLSLRQTEILDKLSNVVDDDTSESIPAPIFHTEYTRFMLESTPGYPYTGSIQDLVSVEFNMRHRRVLVRRHLNTGEVPITTACFPRLGAPGVFTDPCICVDDIKSSQSYFLPDVIISPHEHYLKSSANLITRRGSKVAINTPIFFDDRTPRPFVDPTIPWDRSLHSQDSEAKNGAALIDHIYMDAIPFGMGCCSLQLTLQCYNVDEARRMYDSLIPITPIMLALSAASPIWRGYLSDVDCRWSALSGSTDDRTLEERGCVPLKQSKYIIPKSRGDTVDLYLSTHWNNKPGYNDIYVPFNEETYSRLVDHGVDELLSKHFAHLFIRDPLVLFSESINLDNEKSSDHFESLQSTNWQTLRFKPPPPKSAIGWRVEFRSMEVQLTDFENAAYCVFVVLLSRAIMAFNLNFYIPMSKVEENMQRAQKRDAVRTAKFSFRRDVFPPGQTKSTSAPPESCPRVKGCNGAFPKERLLQNGFSEVSCPPAISDCLVEDEYEEMTLEETFNGKGTTFPGLVGLIEAYLETLDIDSSERKQIDKYISLIRLRADGTLFTTARWMREFVRSHPAYRFDSVVSQEINYDLMMAVDEIERGILRDSRLLPEDYVPLDIPIRRSTEKCIS